VSLLSMRARWLVAVQVARLLACLPGPFSAPLPFCTQVLRSFSLCLLLVPPDLLQPVLVAVASRRSLQLHPSLVSRVWARSSFGCCCAFASAVPSMQLCIPVNCPLAETPALAARALDLCAESFDRDVDRLQDILRIGLSDDQRDAYKHRYFNETRAAIREGRFDMGKESTANLRAVLSGFVHTATRRRLSTLSGGLYLDGLIKGCETRGRPSDVFYAVRVEDGAVGAAKIFYAAPAHEEPNPASAAAEWDFSQRLDAAATAAADRGGEGHRQNVVRYSDIVDLGNGRTALFMPAYTRSLHQLMEESHVSVPLPAPFLLRSARDVLRGLCLLHAAGLAHCDVKPDNIMYAGDGTAILIDLGAVTQLGQPVVEGMPPSMALGIDLSRGSAKADLVGLASTLWWALRRTMPPSGSTPLTLAQQAEELAAGHEPLASQVLQAIAAILRAESADAALAALGAIVAA